MRAVSAPWLDGISGAAAIDLIRSDDRLIRVVAGPGAGKTTCLKRRTQRLIEGDGVDPGDIFVGTFTRAIASDLRAELGDEIEVSTLHSLASRLLREHPAATQGMRLRFLLAYEEDALLYDVAADVPGLTDQNHRRRELLRLQSARAERAGFDDAVFAGAVRRWLQHHGGMLVGEVVYLAVVGLENGDIPHGRYVHVVVDEYQDLTAAEQQLVELVWSRTGSLVVMGDNNQSIYAFRFNHPEGIDEFWGRWADSGAVDLSFPDNRRCGSKILDVANLMMAEADGSSEPMESASGRIGTVDLVHWPTVDDEIAGLASHMKAHADESFLVLVPRRFVGYRLRDQIGDDARTAFHEQILEYQVAQERFALASVLADPEDRVALRAWLGFHGQGQRQAQRRNAVAYGRLPSDVPSRDLVERIASGEIDVSGEGQASIRARAQQLLRFLEDGLENSLDVVDLAFDPCHAEGEDDPEKRRWLEQDLLDLRSGAWHAVASLNAPTLTKVVAALRYRIATRAPLLPEAEPPRVQIMTLHSAKGLESDNIVVAGAADQLIPGLSTDAAEIEEQRRVLYVAVTRAKDSLVVSWSRAVNYADAMANHIRTTDGVFTSEGERYVRLSRTSLLPQALGGARPGEFWLGQQ